MPYRTAENVIEGVVVTFVNIGYLKDLEEAGERSRAYFAAKLEDFEVGVEIPRLGRRTFALNARRLEQPAEEGSLILLALEDMTSG
jgi:hypothetical protein